MRFVAISLVPAALFFITAADSLAQPWGHVEGHVHEAGTGIALEAVAVVIDGTNFGTATDAEGFYRLSMPAGRHVLRFSSVGYAARKDTVTVRSGSQFTLDVDLTPSAVEMDELVVEERATSGAGIQQIAPEQVRNMPSPLKGFQALHVLLGVTANNELSNQYSVRGGGFNENLIFLNGFEVHMPFRPRQGEQEGLGLLNPELARRITLYTGGFPARYGGKISSALDIVYRTGERFGGSAYVSLLDAGVSTSATTGRLSWLIGARKAQARRFYATQELKGNYQPDYSDIQGHAEYSFTPGHSLELTAIWADHSFRLDPRGRKTFYGVISVRPDVPSDLRSVWINYDDRSTESDGYTTSLFGLRLKSRLSAAWHAEHDVSVFQTRETENFLLIGNTVIYDVRMGPDVEENMVPRGNALQEEAADNYIGVITRTAKGRYILGLSRHVAEGGWFIRSLAFEDRIDESSAVEGYSPGGDLVRVEVNRLEGSQSFGERQLGFYAQDAVAPLFDADQLVITAGLRADYFSFNREWTISPRLSARYEASDNLTLTGAWGLYYQAPTYRELRGDVGMGTPYEAGLNRDIRSQRSVQLVAGAELFVPKRRIYVRGEAYWKRLTNLISYTLENVRIEYSGDNDSEGYVYGLDLQARGEFVPGLESWINYGFLVARERFVGDYVTEYRAGTIARPTDQRHTVALFVQDYVPLDPTWKLHLRAIFGSGLPYTPPVPGDRVGQVIVQEPGPRLSARYPEYRRMDFGVTKSITIREDALHLELTAEVLNIFDIQNTVAYSWVPDVDGIWQRVPTRLTPRTINVRLRVVF